jgi:hypothetical protein
MKSFKHHLTELFDQPFPFASVSIVNGDVVKYVYRNDATFVVIMFFDLGNGGWDVIFSRNGKVAVTGQGDAGRVFASVLDAFQRFLRDYGDKANTISFTAEKQELNPSTSKYTTDSRVTLYKAMIKRYAEANGYRMRSNIPISGIGKGKQLFVLEKI